MLRKNIIIIASVVFVIIGALLAIYFIESASDDYEPPEQPMERIFVLGDETGSAAGVLSVEVQSELGSFTIVNANPAEEAAQRFTLVGFEDFNLQNNSIMWIANTARNLQASEILFEGDADLYALGLANPSATVIINYLDNSSAMLLIGDTAPGGNNVYVMRGGDDTVYLIPLSVADIFVRRDIDLVDLVITETPAEMPDITRAVLGGSVRPEPILIERVSQQEENNQLFLPTHSIVSPIHSQLHMFFGLEPLFHAYSLRANLIEARFESPEELVRWGLDEPYSTLKIESSTHESFMLMVSAPGENGTVYLVRESMPFVYNVSVDTLPWLRLTYFDIMDRHLVMPHIDSVSLLEIHKPDRTINIELEGEGDNLEVFVDGFPYETADGVDSAGNFRLLYQDFIATRIESIPDELMLSELPSLPVILQLVYNYRDGSPSDSVTFFEGSARRVLVQLNNETPMLVLSIFVDHLFRSIDSFLAGEKVMIFV